MQCDIESMAIFGIRGAVYARSHTNKIKRKKTDCRRTASRSLLSSVLSVLANGKF